MDRFAVAEVLRCCWLEAVEEEDPGGPALDEAGSGCKAHCCCCCCCQSQKCLLVTTGHVGDDLCLPWLELMLCER